MPDRLYVIDRDGRIAKEWRGVRVPGHAQEVLDFIRSRGGQGPSGFEL